VNAVLAATVIAHGGGGTISGLVTGPAGPVAGATVTATRAEDGALSDLPCEGDEELPALEVPCEAESEHIAALVAQRSGEVVPVARTTSRSDGTFTLEGLEDGRVAVWADTPRLGTALTQDVEVGAHDVSLELRGVRISGRVVIDRDRPGAGAWITLVHPGHSRFFDAIADADGRFSFGPLPDAEYALVAGAAGTMPAHLKLFDTSSDVLVKLWTPRRLVGVVEYRGAGVPDVEIQLRGEKLSRETKSTAGGAFSLENVHPGVFAILARRDDLKGTAALDLPSRGDFKPVHLVLRQRAVVVGHVRADGRPVAEFRIRESLDNAVASDETGAFRLVLAPGYAVIHGHGDGFADVEKRLEVRPGEQTVDFDLVPNAPVVGMVVDTQSGAPVPHAQVSIGREFTVSDDDGAFAFGGLAAGQYQVTASHQGYVRTATQVQAPSNGARVRIDPGLRLSGVVVDERGRGTKANLNVALVGESVSAGADTSDAGEFVIGGLTAGAYQVRVDAYETSRTASAAVTLPSASPLRIVLDPLFSIGGVVVDRDGTPIAGARVLAISDGHVAYGIRGHSDQQGRFAVNVPSKGEYQLRASATDELDLDHTTAAQTGDSNVRLVFEASPRIRGRVVDSKHEPVGRFTIAHRPIADPDGFFDVQVKKSDTVISVQSKGRASREVPLPEDKHALTDLGDVVLEDGRAVLVRVLNAEGPVAGASVELPGGRSEVRTDGMGEATLRGLGAADHELLVSARGYVSQRSSLNDSDAEKRVTLVRGASLFVTIYDAVGALVRSKVTAIPRDGQGERAEDWSESDGDVHFAGLAAGRWLVVARGQAGRAEGQVTLGESGEQQLQLTLRTGTSRVALHCSRGPGAWVPERVGLFPAQAGAAAEAGLPLGDPYESGTGATPLLYELVNVPPGPYDAVVYLKDGEHHAWTSVPVTVGDDAKTEVNVPAPDPAALHAIAVP
jgi:hypothetical protein